MTDQDPDPLPSTPTSRREWAVQYAKEKAAAGEHVTVRNLQDAIYAHFGKKISQELARQIAKSTNTGGTAPEQSVIRHRNWPSSEYGLTVMATRLMQEGWVVTSIKTNDDGTMTMILSPASQVPSP